MNKINVAEKYAQFNDHWHPRIIGELNGQHVKIAKIKDEFVWHSHQQEDELFLVWKGTLLMEFRDKTVEVATGELLIVPQGVEHRPRTNGEEVWIMMLEPVSTVNTGSVKNERTRTELETI